MGNTEIAYAASPFSPTASAFALEVRERAVTQGDTRGQVCPLPGAIGSGELTWHTSDLSSPASALRPTGFLQSGSSETGIATQSGSLETGIAAIRYRAEIGVFSVMSNVQVSKPRTGYCATSGTG